MGGTLCELLKPLIFIKNLIRKKHFFNPKFWDFGGSSNHEMSLHCISMSCDGFAKHQLWSVTESTVCWFCFRWFHFHFISFSFHFISFSFSFHLISIHFHFHFISFSFHFICMFIFIFIFIFISFSLSHLYHLIFIFIFLFWFVLVICCLQWASWAAMWESCHEFMSCHERELMMSGAAAAVAAIPMINI